MDSCGPADEVLTDHVQVVSLLRGQDHAVEVSVTILLFVQILDNGEEDLHKPLDVVSGQLVERFIPISFFRLLIVPLEGRGSLRSFR